jgi:HEAT repeat protein
MLKTNFSLSLKKCLTPKNSFRLASGLLLLSLGASLETRAAPAPSKDQSALYSQIENDLTEQRHSQDFSELLNQWENQLGKKAIPPLLSIAQNSEKTDTSRYIAIMGAAKLGGESILPQIAEISEDSSWMVRNAVLQALRMIGNAESGKIALKLSKDPALVVRLEAIQTLGLLQPEGTKETLLEAILDLSNYHRGKALWVPEAALKHFVRLYGQSENIQKLKTAAAKIPDPQMIAYIQNIPTPE